MFFLHREDGLHQTSGRGIGVAEVIDHIAVAIDGDALSDRVGQPLLPPVGMKLKVLKNRVMLRTYRAMAKDIQHLPGLVQYHHTAHETQGMLHA
jgi:hypothetical protein